MSSTTLLDELLDPLSQCLDDVSAQRLIDFRIAPAVQRRMEELAERANEGLLSSEERSQYEAMIHAADLISILKLKARRQLPSTS